MKYSSVLPITNLCLVIKLSIIPVSRVTHLIYVSLPINCVLGTKGLDTLEEGGRDGGKTKACFFVSHRSVKCQPGNFAKNTVQEISFLFKIMVNFTF